MKFLAIMILISAIIMSGTAFYISERHYSINKLAVDLSEGMMINKETNVYEPIW